MNLGQAKGLVLEAWDNRELLEKEDYKKAIRTVIEHLDQGKVRVAELRPSGPTPKQITLGVGSGEEEWQVNEWVKKAVILYFPIQKMEIIEVGQFEFHDKIALKTGHKEAGVRVVPHAIARYGSFLEPDTVMMPSYVNIGAYVGSGTMVDTWATVGSCAQIGKNVHLSGGVGIGGVLEPIQAAPVIVEDGAFIGSRCIIVEGVHIGKEAVLGANVVLTKTTKVIDVSGPGVSHMAGIIPPRSVVIPGTYPKEFPGCRREFNVPCALIIGQRKESTDRKTSLNEALRGLREQGVAV